MKMKLPKKSELAGRLANRRVKLIRRKGSSTTDVVPAETKQKSVKQHRSEVIGRGRKYIYPLKPTKRRVVIVSLSLLLAALIIFLTICGFLLYKFQSTSTFIYHVTQVVPFPVAKAGDSFVSYESYLFDVRRYAHYYQYRLGQPVDFSTGGGAIQLNHYKQEALDNAVNLAYVKQLAKRDNISVTSDEVDQTFAIAMKRIGNNRQEFASVLNTFWGWSISDYRRELKQELLVGKVISELDTGAHKKADLVMNELKGGTKFSTLAKKYSDDKVTSKDGGRYPELISSNDADISPKIVSAAFSLKNGQVTGPMLVYNQQDGYSLQILKRIKQEDDKLEVSHIQINLAPLSKYVKPLKTKNPPTYFISIPKSS